MKLTQELLAKAAHLSGSYFSNILSLRRSPRWTTAKKLARLTATPVEYWMDATPGGLGAIKRRINTLRRISTAAHIPGDHILTALETGAPLPPADQAKAAEALGEPELWGRTLVEAVQTIDHRLDR